MEVLVHFQDVLHVFHARGDLWKQTVTRTPLCCSGCFIHIPAPVVFLCHSCWWLSLHWRPLVFQRGSALSSWFGTTPGFSLQLCPECDPTSFPVWRQNSWAFSWSRLDDLSNKTWERWVYPNFSFGADLFYLCLELVELAIHCMTQKILLLLHFWQLFSLLIHFHQHLFFLLCELLCDVELTFNVASQLVHILKLQQTNQGSKGLSGASQHHHCEGQDHQNNGMFPFQQMFWRGRIRNS